ncbi:hypothetical protein K4K59_012247 [Colletotrichum sp. SAR11_240]|nr:hypothetical protein K4K59_012247 [Colletotrichum sp. SAR11_240]
MTDKQRIRPGAAATRWEHKAFRKLCALLAQLQGLNTYHGSKISLDGRKLIAADLGAEGNQKRREFEVLECLSGLVPGLMAFTPSAVGDALMKGSDHGSWVIFASINPQWGEVEESDTALPKNGPRLFVNFQDIGETPGLIEILQKEGGVAFWFDQISEGHKLTSNEMLLRHSKNLLAILKKHYHAADQSTSTPEGKGKGKAVTSPTPTVDGQFWAHAFSDLSHTWMFPDVIDRIEHGFERRNFGTILATSVDDVFKIQSKRDGAKALVPEDEMGGLKPHVCYGPEETNRAKCSVNGIAFSKGGRTHAQDVLDVAHRMRQSKVQAEVLSSIYDQFSTWKAKGIIKVDDDTNIEWMTSPLNAQGDPEKIFYDMSGRLAFQSLLSTILTTVTAMAKKAKQAFRELSEEAAKHKSMIARRRLGREPTIAKEQERKTERQRLTDKFVDDLHAYMEASLCLVFLRRHFSDILQSHCRWLEQIFRPTSTHLPGKGWLAPTVIKDNEGKKKKGQQAQDTSQGQTPTAGPSNPPTTKPNRKSILSEPGSASKPFWQFASGSNTPASDVPTARQQKQSTAPPTEGIQDLNISGSSKTEEKDTDDEKLFLDQVSDQYNWNTGAFECLGLICRLQEAIHSVLNVEEDLRIQLKQAIIQPVVASLVQRDMEMISTTEFFTHFPPKGVTLTDEEVATLAQWFDDRFSGGTEYFSGAAAHAEALFFVFLLFNWRKKESNITEPETDDDSGLTLPSQEVIDAFEKLGPAIAVNKRCCPICFRLLQHVERVTGVKFLYAGDHSDWSSVSLPPFTPKEDFDAIFEDALQELWRLHHVRVEADRMGRSTESGGARSAPTRTTPSDAHPTLGHELRGVRQYEKMAPGRPTSTTPIAPSTSGKSVGTVSPSDRRKDTLERKREAVADAKEARQKPLECTMGAWASNRLASSLFNPNNPSAPQPPSKRQASTELPRDADPPSPSKKRRD